MSNVTAAINHLRKLGDRYEDYQAVHTLDNHIACQNSKIRDLEQQIESMRLTLKIESHRQRFDPLMWLKGKVESLTRTVDEASNSPFWSSGVVMAVSERELIDLAGVLGIPWTHPSRRNPERYFNLK